MERIDRILTYFCGNNNAYLLACNKMQKKTLSAIRNSTNSRAKPATFRVSLINKWSLVADPADATPEVPEQLQSEIKMRGCSWAECGKGGLENITIADGPRITNVRAWWCLSANFVVPTRTYKGKLIFLLASSTAKVFPTTTIMELLKYVLWVYRVPKYLFVFWKQGPPSKFPQILTQFQIRI